MNGLSCLQGTFGQPGLLPFGEVSLVPIEIPVLSHLLLLRKMMLSLRPRKRITCVFQVKVIPNQTNATPLDIWNAPRRIPRTGLTPALVRVGAVQKMKESPRMPEKLTPKHLISRRACYTFPSFRLSVFLSIPGF
jgi:hypothetical protein